VGRPSFVAESLSELNVGLYEGSKMMHRAALALLAGSTGWGFSSGADRPNEDGAVLCDLSNCLAFWALSVVHACVLQI
jgi:hypothetical protein